MNQVKFDFIIYREDYINGGKASTSIKSYLTELGLPPQLIRRIVIASYEAEMNIVIHSDGGTIKLIIDETKLVLLSEDQGPGIKDLELAMTPGFSTANEKAREMGFGAGMGLPNMKKNSDEFFIETSHTGTKIKMLYQINLG
jgi:serine/threonine-protein kinase RsbT